MTDAAPQPVEPLTASDGRVSVRPVRAADVGPYRLAVEASRHRLSRWNPVDPEDLLRHVDRQSDVHRTFMVLAEDPAGAHGVVGRINLSSIVRGRFESGSLGYDAYDPYVGTGLFRAGLALVVGLAFTARGRGGVGLHRVEANVQPGNVRSAGLLRSLGFRHEGSTPRMLFLGGPDGRDDWRDHERYAVTAEEWPAEPYRPVRPPAAAVALVADAAAGALLATELGVPCLPADVLAPDVAAAVVASCPRGAVLAGPASTALVEAVGAVARVVTVRADGGDAHAFDGDGGEDAVAELDGPRVVALPDGPLDGRSVTRLALAVRAAGRA